jgi:formate dehydrogenase subunit delta
MNNDNLIRMANQIGAFFESMPDRQEASKDLATHIKKFWDPRMRRAFLAQLDSDGGKELSEIVRAAVQEHRAMLTPAAT